MKSTIVTAFGCLACSGLLWALVNPAHRSAAQGGVRKVAPTPTKPPVTSKSGPVRTKPRPAKSTEPEQRQPSSPAVPDTSQYNPPVIRIPQIEMIELPGGTFIMGSPSVEVERRDDESSLHRVNVPAFAIGKYEITQAQWLMVMHTNPSLFRDENLPVENVTWYQAKQFCQALSDKTGKTYRLPTEAEWEYAARAGTETPVAFGWSLSSSQANFDGSLPYGGAATDVFRRKTTAVGSFAANRFGLFDMHGNVSEWCEDTWHENYVGAPVDGSAWLNGGDSNRRVLRSGSWYTSGRNCRSAARYKEDPSALANFIGFRVVMDSRTR
ncbi:MAG: formylglycine-generating enzyme family protein [Acidobacteria bacterium]|nr:formylglycine-generating enzyme family protein [Acidobacteriota bacterium]